VAKKKRHKHHEDEHVDESWLLPYADLLTLLLALFIVLFSMRSEDEAKATAMMESLYTAFNSISVFDTDSGGQTPSNNSNTSNVIIPDEIPEPEEEVEPESEPEKEVEGNVVEEQLQELMAKLQKYVDENGLEAEISLTDLQEGIQITLKDKIVFDSGSNKLKSEFIPTLNDIATMLSTLEQPIVIEGHTDNKPINNSKFPSNWELSASRALSVLHYFQGKGIDPHLLRFSGYGEYQPLYPNDSAKNREANRRVNITVLR
jgi:chemotaxis protein MotB